MSRRLGIDAGTKDVAELGCGYGTFTIPVARAVSGKVYAFDIEPEMVSRTEKRAALAGLGNVICRERDVMSRGFGLAEGSIDAVLLFNILHCDEPQAILEWAADILHPAGRVYVIHWRFDARTPRGPSLEIRPKPEQIVAWAVETGRLVPEGDTLDLPPWHYGLKFKHG